MQCSITYPPGTADIRCPTVLLFVLYILPSVSVRLGAQRLQLPSPPSTSLIFGQPNRTLPFLA
jgi:hypothetical protein